MTSPAAPAFDRAFVEIARRARVLPALHPRNAAAERARLTDELERGIAPTPRWEPLDRADVRGLVPALDRIRAALADALPPELVALYAARLDELELDVAILAALGHARQLRPLVARRFGTGDDLVLGRPLRAHAAELLARAGPSEDPPVVSAVELAARMGAAAAQAGLEVSVRIEPRLSAGAAMGDRTVFVQDRLFGEIEARRLVAHEILGHAVAAARAVKERLGIFEAGTAEAFADQEGVAIALEERAGALDGARLRTLAARVVATDRLHAGAPFGETARLLVDELGLTPRAAVSTAERAYRGGGVARDAGYLAGFVRVRDALEGGRASVEELLAGRVSVRALPALRWAREHGWARPLEPTSEVAQILGRAERAARAPGS